MELKQRKEGNVLIIKLLEKRLDEPATADFKEKMAEFVKRGNESIVLNLSEVNFVDSSGLGSIISSMKMLGQKEDFAICGMQETVLNLFRITKMDKLFKIFPDEKEAVAALSK